MSSYLSDTTLVFSPSDVVQSCASAISDLVAFVFSAIACPTSQQRPEPCPVGRVGRFSRWCTVAMAEPLRYIRDRHARGEQGRRVRMAQAMQADSLQPNLHGEVTDRAAHVVGLHEAAIRLRKVCENTRQG